MLFNSMTFIGIFLPICIISILIAPKKFSNFVLLIASILFYIWGAPKDLYVILTVILSTFVGALCINKYPKYKLYTLISVILINLYQLFYFKYINFIVENLNNLFSLHISHLNIILPLGISFYTFQALSYVIDVYRGLVTPQKNIFKYALFVFFFPTLIAGPILRYTNIYKQIDNRELSLEKFEYGITRFIVGLGKKMFIANTLGLIVDKIFEQPPTDFSPIIAWLGAISYTLQIYFDFSGYSDMAIGLAAIFGFIIPENFSYPFISKSITEFWRRWHISLSSWFKDYLFYPLIRSNFNVWLLKTCPLCFNELLIYKINSIFILLIVWTIIGLWHGASWTFVIFGLYHGILLAMELLLKRKTKAKNIINEILKHSYAILAIIIGFVIFRAPNIFYCISYLKNMFGINPGQNLFYEYPYYFNNTDILIFILAIFCSCPLFAKFIESNKDNLIVKVFTHIGCILLFVFSLAIIAESTYNSFIYFRF